MRKSKFSLVAILLISLGATITFTSCQEKEDPQVVVAAKIDNTRQMRAFEEALKSLNSKTNIEANKKGRMSSEKVFQNTLIDEAKELIYTTGVTSQQLTDKFGIDDAAIISEALKIHAKNANGNLNN
jgi:hypothetical protein